MPATQACPKCGQPMTYDSTAALYRCRNCGQRVEQQFETLEQAEARIAAKGARPAVPITHRGEVEMRAQSAFETGHDALWREDKAEAIRQFTRAVELQPDFADAHLWLARLSDDERVKRDHLGEILAHDPGHLEALREMMILNKRLTPEGAARAGDSNARPEIRTIAGTVRGQHVACPQCGGTLVENVAAGRVECAACGYSAPLPDRASADQADIVGMALLERRAAPVRWQIGERVLHCTECGAERTLPARRIAQTCPFCGSQQVIMQDALAGLEQPTGIIPFQIDEAGAKAAIREKLRGFGERLLGVFDDNRIVNASIEGVYLPFWVFDAITEVTVTEQEKQAHWRDQRQLLAGDTGYHRTSYRDGVYNVDVCAAKAPPPTLTDALDDYEFDAVQAYDPRLLATHPAEIYDIDVDAASLIARGRAAKHSRAAALRNANPNRETTASALVLQMSVQLVLMPVWIAALLERDGDLRPALVHGQTGQVVLGKARKSSSEP